MNTPNGRLSGKRAIVTGGASGIGRATALLFAWEGARVVVTDIDADGASTVAREITDGAGEALAMELDVTSAKSWEDAIEKTRDAWGGLDSLVNSAGITDEAKILDIALETWRRVFAVNLEGTLLGTAAAMRAMQDVGRGSIVNVSSYSGIKAGPGAVAYCCSKAAILQLTRVAALECTEMGTTIRVNCVAPGGVKTPMWEKTSMWPDISTTEEWKAARDAPALKRFAEPEEVAAAILFLASDESSYVNGTILPVDGGALA